MDMLEDFEVAVKYGQFFLCHSPTDRLVCVVQNSDTLGTLVRVATNYLADQEEGAR